MSSTAWVGMGAFTRAWAGKLRGLLQVMLLGKVGAAANSGRARERQNCFMKSVDLVAKVSPHKGDDQTPEAYFGKVASTVSRPFTFWSRPTWMSEPEWQEHIDAGTKLDEAHLFSQATCCPGLMYQRMRRATPPAI